MIGKSVADDDSEGEEEEDEPVEGEHEGESLKNMRNRVGEKVSQTSWSNGGFRKSLGAKQGTEGTW